VAFGRDATLTKSCGVRVIPIESISAASPAVKYSVVNHANEDGLLNATALQITVHKGNNVVATFAVFSYPSKIFCPNVFSSPAAAAEDASYSDVPGLPLLPRTDGANLGALTLLLA